MRVFPQSGAVVEANSCHAPAGSPQGGQFCSDPVRTFHGTSVTNLDSILKDGIRVSHAGSIWPNFSSREHTYVTSSLDSAYAWARETASRLWWQRNDFVKTDEDVEAVLDQRRTRTAHEKPAIFRVEIPRDAAKAKLRLDPHFKGSKDKNFQFAGDIPASWITDAWVQDLTDDGDYYFKQVKGSRSLTHGPGIYDRVKVQEASRPFVVYVGKICRI